MEARADAYETRDKMLKRTPASLALRTVFCPLSAACILVSPDRGALEGGIWQHQLPLGPVMLLSSASS